MPAFQQQTTEDFATAASPSATQQQLQAAQNGAGLCDPAVVKTLETYLEEQVQGSSVDIDADLALLKLYQVYPAQMDADKVAKVLVKAIMAMPSTFFAGASAMVPESIREDTNVADVLRMGFQLQSCLFEDFWKEDVTFATSVPGFLASVRTFILTAISRSHSAIATDVFKAKLNVSDKEVAEIVAAEEWGIAGDVISIAPNAYNQMQAKKVQENIEFQDVLKVIHTLSR